MSSNLVGVFLGPKSLWERDIEVDMPSPGCTGCSPRRCYRTFRLVLAGIVRHYGDPQFGIFGNSL